MSAECEVHHCDLCTDQDGNFSCRECDLEKQIAWTHADYALKYAELEKENERLRIACIKSIPWVAIMTSDAIGVRRQAAKNAEEDLKYIQEAIAQGKGDTHEG